MDGLDSYGMTNCVGKPSLQMGHSAGIQPSFTKSTILTNLSTEDVKIPLLRKGGENSKNF